jgi:uncharacterized protein (TIGR02453 family)
MSLQKVFNFLSELKIHNNRDWFKAQKTHYNQAYEAMMHFADELLDGMRKFDQIETVSGKKSLYRIYRDVRFSKDKQPYKTSWSGSFKRATKELRGGYYFHIEPGNTFIAGGFFGPNPGDLRLIRNHIDQDDAPVQKVLNSHEIKSFFGSLVGEQVKTAPQGFSKDHHAIDLLRQKQFILQHNYSDAEVLRDGFSLKMAQGFQKLIPFFDVMSEMLTTDLNGNAINLD